MTGGPYSILATPGGTVLTGPGIDPMKPATDKMAVELMAWMAEALNVAWQRGWLQAVSTMPGSDG